MNHLKLTLVVLLSICVSGLLTVVPASAVGQKVTAERVPCTVTCDVNGMVRSSSSAALSCTGELRCWSRNTSQPEPSVPAEVRHLVPSADKHTTTGTLRMIAVPRA